MLEQDGLDTDPAEQWHSHNEWDNSLQCLRLIEQSEHAGQGLLLILRLNLRIVCQRVC